MQHALPWRRLSVCFHFLLHIKHPLIICVYRYCGGPNRILIYTKPGTDTTPTEPTGPWAPAQGGCWSDNVDHVRALEHGANGYDDLTPAKCQAICEAQGFNLAGVEYGRECCTYFTSPLSNRMSDS
jgi:hypothetical protein